MTTLTLKAVDDGTYIITCKFTDADGSSATPITLEWNLKDSSGNTINNRTGVTISPSSSVSIVLSGDDVDYSDGVHRVFSIEGTYNSSTYGNGLPIKGQAKFDIEQWT